MKYLGKGIATVGIWGAVAALGVFGNPNALALVVIFGGGFATLATLFMWDD